MKSPPVPAAPRLSLLSDCLPRLILSAGFAVGLLLTSASGQPVRADASSVTAGNAAKPSAGDAPVVKNGDAVRLGDILMRSLRVWSEDAADEHDTLAAAKAFQVDRIVWIYENTEEFNEKVREAGIGIGTTMSQQAREAWYPQMTQAERREFVDHFTVVNLDGEQVIPRHMKKFGPNAFITHFQADQSSAEWFGFYAHYVEGLYALGIDTIHRDDPLNTARAPTYGGSFTDSVVEFFREYLVENYSAEELAALGVDDPADFNVREHFKELGAPTDYSLWQWRGSPLMPIYLDALMEIDRLYYLKLKAALEERTGRDIPWSNNGVGPVQAGEEAFDFRIGEYQSHHNQPQTLYEMARYAQDVGKLQAWISFVDRNWETLDTFVPDLRRHIGTAYAYGTLPLVPWCMYMHDAPRYYGTVEDFGDLFHFVSDHRELFDGHELVSIAGTDTLSTLYSWSPNRELSVLEDAGARVWPGHDNVFAVVRKDPGSPDRAVVHWVDWNPSPEPTAATLFPRGLVGSGAAKLTLLRPGEEPVVWEDFAGGTIEVPAVDPWGIFVVEAETESVIPAPIIISPTRRIVPAGTEVRFAPTPAGTRVFARLVPEVALEQAHFAPLEAGEPIRLDSGGALEAYTAKVGGAREARSPLTRIVFQTFEDLSVGDLPEQADLSFIDLTEEFRVVKGEQKIDGSFLSETPSLLGEPFERGFATQGATELVAEVDETWSYFFVDVGIDDAEDRRPAARIQVFFDGRLAYETPIFNPSKLLLSEEDRMVERIALAIPEGTESLRLKVVPGGFFDDQNNFLWVEPRAVVGR